MAAYKLYDYTERGRFIMAVDLLSGIVYNSLVARLEATFWRYCPIFGS
jgi:hypothetical protein